jgi:hypothetical protein
VIAARIRPRKTSVRLPALGEVDGAGSADGCGSRRSSPPTSDSTTAAAIPQLEVVPLRNGLQHVKSGVRIRDAVLPSQHFHG